MGKVKSYRCSKMMVKDDAISGIGVFAISPISKGEIVWIRSGRIMTLDEAKKLNDRLLGFSVQIHDNFLLCAINEEEVSDFIIHFNHSCKPNVGLSGDVTYVAMKDIEVDEELVVDYAMFITRPFRLDCNCRTLECRGEITGDDWKLAELKKKYGNYFAYYIQRKLSVINNDILNFK